MSDIRKLDDATIINLKATGGKVSEVIKVYETFPANAWYENRNISIKEDLTKCRKLRSTITRLVTTKIGTDDDLKSIKNQTTHIASNFAKVVEEVHKDKSGDEGIAAVLKQRNFDIDKILKDLKSTSGKGNKEGVDPLKYTPGQNVLMMASNMAGLVPLAAALKGSIDATKYLNKFGEEFGRSDAGKWLAKTSFGKSVSKGPLGKVGKVIGKIANGSSSEPSESGEPGGFTSTVGESVDAGSTTPKVDNSYSAFQRRGKWYEAERNDKGQIKKMAEIDAFQAGLIKFFSTSAFRTKWTKDLLEAVQGGGPQTSGTKSPEGGGAFGGILSTLGKVASGVLSAIGKIGGSVLGGVGKFLGSKVGSLGAGGILGSAVAIGGAGLAGWGAGRWVGENVKVGGKTVDQQAQGFFSNTLFGGENAKAQQMNNASNVTDPKTRKRMQLIRGGMSSQEASRVANGNPITPWKPDWAPKVSKGTDKEGFNYTETDFTGGPATKAKEAADIKAMANKQALEKKQFDADVKRFFPQGTSGLSKAEVAKSVTSMRTSELKNEKSDALAGISDATGGTAKSLSEVPMNSEQAQLQKEVKDAVDKLNKSVTDMHQTIKDNGKSTSKKAPSGYDANNTRNPMLSSLSAGNLDGS